MDEYDLRRAKRVKTYNTSEGSKICYSASAYDNSCAQKSSHVKRSSNKNTRASYKEAQKQVVVSKIANKD